jgi:elongation factor P
MNTETFEQISLNKKYFRLTRSIKEGENVMVSINTETDLPFSRYAAFSYSLGDIC